MLSNKIKIKTKLKFNYLPREVKIFRRYYLILKNKIITKVIQFSQI